jgi:ubiquinone/menaquinone biosynthesis C-methylase UbiE
MRERVPAQDPFLTITEASPDFLEETMAGLERRAALPEQRAMRDAYLSEVAFHDAARVLEVGCGTGPVTRDIAGRAGVGQVVGVDPSPTFIARARELAAGSSNVNFQTADGRSLPFDAASFDVVVFHTTLCHVPEPELCLREAARVLRPGGTLAVFDWDYASLTFAVGDDDPLESLASTFVASFVSDRYLVRRLAALTRAAGFAPDELRHYGVGSTAFMQTAAERAIGVLLADGRIAADLADALRGEVRRRVESGTFFGFLGAGSLVARKAG